MNGNSISLYDYETGRYYNYSVDRYWSAVVLVSYLRGALNCGRYHNRRRVVYGLAQNPHGVDLAIARLRSRTSRRAVPTSALLGLHFRAAVGHELAIHAPGKRLHLRSGAGILDKAQERHEDLVQARFDRWVDEVFGRRRRAIEVKGRAGTGDVEVSDNEWARACNLRQEYWLHVVFHSASPRPRLVRVQDPFAKLLVKSRGVIVNDRDIIEVGESGWTEPSSGSRLPELLRPLFWDYPFVELRWPTHRDLVIGRVLQNGGTEAIAWIRKTAGDMDLAAWIHGRDGRGLDARQLRFW